MIRSIYLQAAISILTWNNLPFIMEKVDSVDDFKMFTRKAPGLTGNF